MTATFFSTELDFRAWLEKNHLLEKELIVGFYKVGSSKPSMTWSQSVDQALCFGWIDGIRRSIDKDSYCIRFTPRRPSSIWSDINIKKVNELSRLGLMKTEGLAAFNLRKENKSGIYSHEKDPSAFDASLEKQFKSNKTAWDFFVQQAPSYQKVMKHWIMSAKQEKTKFSRLNKLIESSERQLKLT